MQLEGGWGLRINVELKRYWVPNNVASKKNVEFYKNGPKTFWSKEVFGPKMFWGRTNFGVKKYLDPKQTWAQKMLG